MKKSLTITGILVVLVLIFVFITPVEDEQEASSESSATTTSEIVVAENLDVPWDVVFLPDNSLLVTQRTGSIVRVNGDQTTTIPFEASAAGEGGLLGMTLHPDFEDNRYLYMYATHEVVGGLTNNVLRYEFDMETNELTGETVIIEGIPGASYHDGGRIRFDSDNFLYITTGDAGDEDSAQDLSSLAGKILRLHDDGSVPEDNPFGTPVWSYGHRNPQGIAWDEDGNMWSTEHGRSGIRSGYDELNLIVPGGNYGWPVIQGDETAEGMIAPVLHSGANTTWAPASLVAHDDYLYWGGLRGEALYRVEQEGTNVSNLTRLIEDVGRVRAVVVGPEDELYITTSNTDGRGVPRAGDDKIIRLAPSE